MITLLEATSLEKRERVLIKDINNIFDDIPTLFVSSSAFVHSLGIRTLSSQLEWKISGLSDVHKSNVLSEEARNAVYEYAKQLDWKLLRNLPKELNTTSLPFTVNYQISFPRLYTEHVKMKVFWDTKRDVLYYNRGIARSAMVNVIVEQLIMETESRKHLGLFLQMLLIYANDPKAQRNMIADQLESHPKPKLVKITEKEDSTIQHEDNEFMMRENETNSHFKEVIAKLVRDSYKVTNF